MSHTHDKEGNVGKLLSLFLDVKKRYEVKNERMNEWANER